MSNVLPQSTWTRPLPVAAESPIVVGDAERFGPLPGQHSMRAVWPQQQPPPPSLPQSEDPRQVAQTAVRIAAAQSTDQPPPDRGRPPQAGPPVQTPAAAGQSQTTPSRRDRYNVNIDVENGFTYVDVAASEGSPSKRSPTRRPPDSSAQPDFLAGVDPTTPQRSRNGSFGSGKPRGLSFYDARQHMRSGRGARPRSWHEAPNGAAAAAALGHEISPRSRSRSRSRSPFDTRPRDEEDVYSDIDLDGNHGGEPPTPPRHMPMHQPAVPPDPGKANSRLGWALFLNSSAKNHLVASLGELIGTTMFLFFAFAGSEVASVNSPSSDAISDNVSLIGFNVNKLIYISLAFGFSLMVNVWIFFRVSGGLFNPAVTLALLLTGAINFVRAFFLLIAQLAGGIAASAMVLGLFPGGLSTARTDLKSGVSISRGLFIEAILTAELVFTILMLAKEKHKATFIAPLGIGFALFIAELVGVFWTGGSLNPTRSFGPNVVTWNWKTNHWIYWAGPTIGSLIAVIVYKILKALEFELANPGQDADETSDPAQNPYQHVRERQREVTARLLKNFGIDPSSAAYGYGPIGYNDGESLGVINLWHKRPNSSIMGGNAPGFGPLGTPIRRSEEENRGWR